jgi:hypothetical protein
MHVLQADAAASKKKKEKGKIIGGSAKRGSGDLNMVALISPVCIISWNTTGRSCETGEMEVLLEVVGCRMRRRRWRTRGEANQGSICVCLFFAFSSWRREKPPLLLT